MLKTSSIAILDRVSEPNNRRPKYGRPQTDRSVPRKIPQDKEGFRASKGGPRPFRGAKGPGRDSEAAHPPRETWRRDTPGGGRPFRGDSRRHEPYGGRPNPRTANDRGEERYESPWAARADALPEDSITAYIAEREGGSAAAGKSRFVSPFSIPETAKGDLTAFLAAVAETFPVQPSRRKLLKEDVVRLWRDLTSERALRSADYLGHPASLAAYVRYFMAWNVVRLVPVLASLPLDPPKGAKILDIGSGPLTLPIALWIARPDLRDRGLRIVCTDRVRKAMESGASLLDALRLKTGGPILGEEAWKIEIRRAVFPDTGGPIRADVVTSANAFTEFFWKAGRKESTLGEKATDLVRTLESSCKPGGAIFLVEPGEPRSGAMLAALREAALLAGNEAVSPCPHERACPMAGAFGGMGDREDGRARSALAPVHMPHWRPKMPWCHFPVPLYIAPQALIRFSEEIGLPKERLTVSWLALKIPGQTVKKTDAEQKGPLKTRLVSDTIALPGGWEGRYACSDLGYTLVVGPAAKEAAGSVLELERPGHIVRDDKSGAVLIGP